MVDYYIKYLKYKKKYFNLKNQIGGDVFIVGKTYMLYPMLDSKASITNFPENFIYEGNKIFIGYNEAENITIRDLREDEAKLVEVSTRLGTVIKLELQKEFSEKELSYINMFKFQDKYFNTFTFREEVSSEKMVFRYIGSNDDFLNWDGEGKPLKLKFNNLANLISITSLKNLLVREEDGSLMSFYNIISGDNHYNYLYDNHIELIDIDKVIASRSDISPDSDRIRSISYLHENNLTLPPIKVEKEEDVYRLLDGNHRYTFSKSIGLTLIPAIITL